MRLFTFLIQVLHITHLITHVATKPLRVIPSPDVANPLHYGYPTGHQSRNGSHYCNLHVCSSQLKTRSKHLVAANEATHTWENNRLSGPLEYWQLTPETMRQSGAQEFFFEWMGQYQEGKFRLECDSDSAQFTAIQCFASMWWGDFDYRCTIDQIERCQVPTANDIAYWIQGHHHDWTSAQVMDTTRKVYYIYKHFQMVIADLKTDWDIIFRMGTAVGLEAHTTIDGYTPQHDKVRAAQCQLAKDTAEMVVDVTIQAGVMAVNAGQFTGVIAVMAIRAERTMEGAKQTGDYKQAVHAAQQLNLARNSMYYTQWTIGQARKGYSAGRKFSDVRYNDRESQLPGREIPRLEFPHIRGHGLCGNVFGVVEDNAGSQVDQLIVFINDQLHGLRYTVEQVFNSLFVKEQEDLGDVALEDIMRIKDWHGQSTRSYEGLELRVKATIRNAMVSELLAASRQYLKCEDRDDAVEACQQDKSLEPKQRRSLFCPPDHPRLRCQAAHWTKKQIFNHDKELPALKGGGEFGPNGIDLSDLFANSVDRYFVMGVDSYSTRSMYEKGSVIDPSKMAHIPVAVSKVRTVNPGQHHRDFPFSCGDWTSNCTSAFLDRVNIDINDEWDMRRGPLIHHLGLIPEPANRFLLLCNLNVRWPNSGDIMPGLRKSGHSPICGAVKKEIQDMDELEGNYRFCNMDIVREHTFKHEMGFVIGRSTSHKKLCERWLFDNSLKIQERLGSTAIDAKLAKVMTEVKDANTSSFVEAQKSDGEEEEVR